MAFIPRKRKGYKKPRKVYKKAKTVSEAVKKYVKRTISANIEDKCVQVNASFPFSNVLESPDLNAYPMAPSASYWTIATGVGQGNRLGNSVKVKKVMLNYILRPMPYDAITNPNPCPSEVQLMLGYVNQKPTELPTNLDVNKIFQNGNISSAPQGALRDLISVINKDYWTIKKRWTHKIGFAFNDGTGAIPGSQFFANNDFSMNIKKSINITKMLPSHFKFNDGSPETTNKNLFFMFYSVQANGGFGSNVLLSSHIDFWIDVTYEDA